VGDAGQDQRPVGVELLQVVGHLVEGVGQVGDLGGPALAEAWGHLAPPDGAGGHHHGPERAVEARHDRVGAEHGQAEGGQPHHIHSRAWGRMTRSMGSMTQKSSVSAGSSAPMRKLTQKPDSPSHEAAKRVSAPSCRRTSRVTVRSAGCRPSAWSCPGPRRVDADALEGGEVEEQILAQGRIGIEQRGAGQVDDADHRLGRLAGLPGLVEMAEDGRPHATEASISTATSRKMRHSRVRGAPSRKAR
jgi:hypothetical protein